jgi:hypothetical protein
MSILSNFFLLHEINEQRNVKRNLTAETNNGAAVQNAETRYQRFDVMS